jgi:hypothetical protein
MAIDRGGEGPNPLARNGSDGPSPLWEVIVRRFGGGEGPMPLALVPLTRGEEVTVRWGDSHQLGTRERTKAEAIPSNDLPGMAGKPKRKLFAHEFGSGAVCDPVPAGSRLFFRVRHYYSLLDHRCLISTKTDCTSLGTITPDIAYLDQRTKVGEWDWSEWLQRDVMCLVAGQTAFDADYVLDKRVYCEMWELENGTYYYFGFSDEGVAPPPAPLRGHFIVELVAAGDGAFINLGGDRPARLREAGGS